MAQLECEAQSRERCKVGISGWECWEVHTFGTALGCEPMTTGTRGGYIGTREPSASPRFLSTIARAASRKVGADAPDDIMNATVIEWPAPGKSEDTGTGELFGGVH